MHIPHFLSFPIASLWRGRRTAIALSLIATPIGLICGSSTSFLIMQYMIGVLVRHFPALRLLSPDTLSLSLLCLIAGLVVGYAHIRFDRHLPLSSHQKLLISLIVITGSILLGRSIFWILATITLGMVDKPFFMIAGWLTFIGGLIGLVIGSIFGRLLHRLQQQVLVRSSTPLPEWIVAGMITGGLSGGWGAIIGAATYGIYRAWA